MLEYKIRIGQKVEYVTGAGKFHVAIIARVISIPDGIVNLGVWDEDGAAYSEQNVKFDDLGNYHNPQLYTWHWMPSA